MSNFVHWGRGLKNILHFRDILDSIYGVLMRAPEARAKILCVFNTKLKYTAAETVKTFQLLLAKDTIGNFHVYSTF